MVKPILPDDLISVLPISSSTKKIWVGYSGGVDSHVLLHLISKIQNDLSVSISAIHINHGLSKQSDLWVKHCQKICQELEIEFNQITLNAAAPKGESQEAWSRKLRYQAISELIGEDDILLTAHHKDDMAETLLLQLFRGAGPSGLASMPLTRRIGKGSHCRPLLAYNRTDILQWAKFHELFWIEDDSNADYKFDRNYLRHNVLPVIKKRWTGVAQTLTRSAKIQADTSILLGELASIDLVHCLNKENGTLSVSALAQLSDIRGANVFRYWIKLQDYPTPTAAQFARVLDDVIHTESKDEPCVSWNGIQVRRYRDIIFMTDKLPEQGFLQAEINWQLDNECILSMGSLSAHRCRGIGIKADKCLDNQVTVKFRCGSDVIKKSGHHHKLKKLFQESGIPSCYRNYIPLIYIKNKLVAIIGLHTDDDYVASKGEEAILIQWSGTTQAYSLSSR
ncbi:MAG: tRNA(Ile)-lysidine synthase [Gammaproteobacteria bacterium]|jgi:tRNA(Ile)-lysidine synthase